MAGYKASLLFGGQRHCGITKPERLAIRSLTAFRNLLGCERQHMSQEAHAQVGIQPPAADRTGQMIVIQESMQMSYSVAVPRIAGRLWSQEN